MRVFTSFIIFVCLFAIALRSYAEEAPTETPAEVAVESDGGGDASAANLTQTRPEHILPPSEYQVASADLLRYAPETEIRSLMAGDSQFTALISEQDGSVIRGSALLLPDISLHPNQSATFYQLRYALNQYGWISVAGIMPEIMHQQLKDEQQLKQLIERPHNTLDVVVEDTQKQYINQLQLVMSSMLEEASAYPGLIMLVAQGATAGWLVEGLASEQLEMPDVLVLISPYLPDRQLNQKLPAKIAQLPVPILDVWSERDNPWAKATVIARKKASKRYLTMHYRQRELFGFRGLESTDARLGKEIYGYVTYLGW
ncbi:hypothetical protein DS2_16284 [Catenovulum agarivorans DS-2]|uniref:DUF3530 domain-containing protein n=1 Tax=Catenovulum agarivorans DS-2 TaxID=1328313 RepID=W7QKQ8_9ALTE|nr:DUF3530 family protein [Catenovulum agarivorans]EWH08653.1 hypothetical protein DS2_16284 [Catenovulum agarivorans DS-2]